MSGLDKMDSGAHGLDLKMINVPAGLVFGHAVESEQEGIPELHQRISLLYAISVFDVWSLFWQIIQSGKQYATHEFIPR